MKEINLSNGGSALIDDSDFQYINQWKWCRSPQGYASRTSYADGKFIKLLMHRVIADPGEGLEVDHIDRNKLNNTRSNLRCVTHGINERNKGLSSRNKSGYVGVCFNKAKNKWQAATKINGKHYYIGRFQTAEAAKEAYEVFIAERIDPALLPASRV